MTIVIIEIIALLGILILAVKGPQKKKKAKDTRPVISWKYAVNNDGEIVELLNKQGKKEGY